MVPPAQIQPAQAQLAQTVAQIVAQPVSQSRPASATYGALLASAADAVARAQTHGLGPFEDAQEAADAVTDYERFLAIGGRHLQLLLSPARSVATRSRATQRQLASALAALTMERRGGNEWASAGDTLGLAHDLLSTHVGPRGELRTPDAVVLTTPEVQVAAAARVLALVDEPLTLSRDLLRTAGAVQPRTDPPLTRATRTHLRQATSRLTKLASGPTPVAAGSGLLGLLDALPPAHTKIGDGTPPDAIASAGAALRVLRQLSVRQSHGDERANAHSLQELCVLAVTTCTAAEGLLPYGATPLGRVDRAATIDRLRRAGSLWSELQVSLYPRIQGLSKAPGIYHHAIQLVAHATATHPAAARVVLATLPRLALQSAATVATLSQRGELVTCSREPGKPTARWRALTPSEADGLIAGFTTASQATRQASDAVQRHLATAGSRGAVGPVPAQQRTRGLGVSR